jgi:hypothetical protein
MWQSGLRMPRARGAVAPCAGPPASLSAQRLTRTRLGTAHFLHAPWLRLEHRGAGGLAT